MSFFPKPDTPVPADSTLKSPTLPGVFLELVQRAYDALAFAPLGTQVNLTTTQTIATVSLTIPATVFFPEAMTAMPATRAVLSYVAGSEVAPADVPTGWKLKVPGRDGITVVDTNYSSALLMAGYLLKEAERVGNAPTGQGVTTITYNDQTRQFSLNASIPIDPNASPSGVVQARTLDYVGAAPSYVGILTGAS